MSVDIHSGPRSAREMSPRARAASNRIRADIVRAWLAKKRSLAIVFAFWGMWTGLQFRDLFRDVDATSTDYLILTVLTLCLGCPILWAWSRIGRERLKTRR